MKAARFETRALLGGAYLGKVADLRFRLTHLTWLDEQGHELSFGCRGPKIEHVADPYAHTVEELAARPTCPRCAAAWDRLSEAQKEEARAGTAKMFAR